MSDIRVPDIHVSGLIKRIKTGIVRRIEAPIVRYYQNHHPGPAARKFWQILSPFTLKCHPDDRWNLHVYVREWMKVCNIPASKVDKPRRIFLCCAFRGQFTHDLALASLLIWRGHTVIFGYFPRLRSPFKAPREDLPDAGDYLSFALEPIDGLSGGRIKCVDLSQYDDGTPVHDEAHLESRARADAVMALRREHLDESSDPDKKEIEYFRSRGRHAFVAASRFFDQYADRLDLCVIAGGATFESFHVLEAATRFGLPGNCHDKFSFRNTRIINHGNHICGFEDIDDIWDRRDKLGLNTKKNRETAYRRAADMVAQRRSGSKSIWVTRTQHAAPGNAAAVRREIGLAADEPFVLVCTNVPFDAGYDRITTIFPSMRDWLITTIRCLTERSGKRVVLRAHPDEARGRVDETAEDILREAGIDASRLIIIPGKQAINTYDLVAEADCGIVFSSTIGLEMVMAGKPVLVGSRVYYAGKGFTVDPEDGKNYPELLVRFVNEIKAYNLTDEQVYDAHLFHFLLHFAILWPYPYDKPSGVGYRPPTELVQSEEMAMYTATLDALALPRAEWLENLGRYVSPDKDNHVAAEFRRAPPPGDHL